MTHEADKVMNLNISSSLIKVGDMITVTGQVNKTTDRCAGYKYTCRYQHIVGCDFEPGFFESNLKYKKCPSGTHIIHQEGKKKITNVGNIIQTVLFAFTLATIAYSVWDVPGFGKSFFKVLFGIKVEGAKEIGSMAHAMNVANFFMRVANAKARQLPQCYRVCAKEETTDVVATSNPQTLCGAGYIIKAEKSSRECSESPPDICGGIGGLKVMIKIKDPYGKTIKQTTVTTDSNGRFTYTFRAPTKEGHYNAIITIV